MKKHMITKLFLLITVLILLAGCSPSISGDENNDSSSPGSDSQTTDTQEPDDQTASGSASAGIDMTGLPDPIDVRSSDDGGLLVLVNKLHTVSADTIRQTWWLLTDPFPPIRGCISSGKPMMLT